MGILDDLFSSGGGLLHFPPQTGWPNNDRPATAPRLSWLDAARQAQAMPDFLNSAGFLLGGINNRANRVIGGADMAPAGSLPAAQSATALGPGANAADYVGLADAFGINGTNGIPLPRQRPEMPQATQPGGGPTSAQIFAPPDAAVAGLHPPAAAALPQGAVPTQAVAQQYAPQQQSGPDFFDRLTAGATNFTTGGNPIAGILNSVRGLATGQRTDSAGVSQANQANMARALFGALQQRGIAPAQAFAIARAAATDPKMAEVLLPQALGLKPPSTVEGVIAEDLHNQRQRGGQQVAGSSVADRGLSALERLEAAKARGSKAGQVQGETQATAELALPSAVAMAQEQLRLISDLRAHPGRKQLGWHDPLGAVPLVPSTKGYDAQKILDQIKGGAFLEAFKTLKGGGQITEVEGKKATEAIARMDRAQSRGEFDKALSDYEGVIRLGIDKANQQAGQAAPGGFRGNSDWKQVSPGVRIRQVQ